MGTLYVVGTPIGNLADISLRALETLKHVELIAAEDTRTTRKLLAHYNIHTNLMSYYEHNRLRRQEQIVSVLERGDVALVSESGTPTISDPGYQLVRLAIDQGFRVSPVPGANAALAVLAISGLPTDAFTFVGFLPRQPGPKREKLIELAWLPHTLVFYESPHRISATLAEMLEVLGERSCVIGREITKVHEEVWRGSLKEAAPQFSADPRGEFTIVVAGRDSERWPVERVQHVFESLRAEGKSIAEAAKEVSAISGWARSAVYEIGLTVE